MYVCHLSCTLGHSLHQKEAAAHLQELRAKVADRKRVLDGQQQLLQLREAMEMRKRELSEGGNAEEQTENVVTINKHQVTAFTVFKLQFPCDHDAACVTSVLCCAANLCPTVCTRYPYCTLTRHSRTS